MLLSEFIKELNGILADKGDVRVITEQEEEVDGAEYNEDGGDPVVVITVR